MPPKKRNPTPAPRGPGIPSAGRAGRNRKEPVDLGRALVEAFLTNERINQVLLDLLDPNVWRAQPPCARRRNIATTFAHIHNVRCMRLTMSASVERSMPVRSTSPVWLSPSLPATVTSTAS